MEVRIRPLRRMTLRQFADEYGLSLDVTQMRASITGAVVWCAQIPHLELYSGIGGYSQVIGYGFSIDQAISKLREELEGRGVRLFGEGPNTRLVRAPIFTDELEGK